MAKTHYNTKWRDRPNFTFRGCTSEILRFLEYYREHDALDRLNGDNGYT